MQRRRPFRSNNGDLTTRATKSKRVLGWWVTDAPLSVGQSRGSRRPLACHLLTCAPQLGAQRCKLLFNHLYQPSAIRCANVSKAAKSRK